MLWCMLRRVVGSSFFPAVHADSEEHPHCIEFGASTDRMDSWGRHLRGVLIQNEEKSELFQKSKTNLVVRFGLSRVTLRACTGSSFCYWAPLNCHRSSTLPRVETFSWMGSRSFQLPLCYPHRRPAAATQRTCGWVSPSPPPPSHAGVRCVAHPHQGWHLPIHPN